MRQRPSIQNIHPIESTGIKPRAARTHVDANAIGAVYDVSGRYVLKLAAEGRIPCLRIGKKCVRFDPDAVARALEGDP